jgi:Fur family transcriptional regulator, zinc uptake regulator
MDRDPVEWRLDAAATICTEDGARLTDLRREVFKLILETDGPVGAYRLLDRLKETRGNAAPPTVYRALDFLMAHGLIHRVERLNAFIPCDDAGRHDHVVQFLICRNCGGVDEVEDQGVADALRHAADAQGFKPGHATVELEGTCATCAAIPG